MAYTSQEGNDLNMSGHSKWHNIQKTKGAADAKRSAAFTKIAREIIVAVKTGGSGDPNNNSRLATVIAKARAANMPNDNIKRTIEKAVGSGTGCVSWSFDQKGVLVIEREDLDEEVSMMDALDCGAADFEADEDCFTVYTAPDDFGAVLAAMEEKGYVFASAKVEMVPQNYVTLSDEGDIKNMEKLIDTMEDNDDVQNIWHNWDE